MSSISARSILHAADAPGRAGAAALAEARHDDARAGARPLRRRERVLLVALLLSLLVHLFGGNGMFDWLSGLHRDDPPESGPPLRTVLKPPPPPVVVESPPPVPVPPPRVEKPKPRPKPRPSPPIITAPVAPPEAPSVAVEEPLPAPAPVAPTADAAPPVVAESPASAVVEEARPAPEPLPPPPVIPVPKRIDLVGSVHVGAQDFFIGIGGFRLRHDGNRYEISVLGRAQGLAKLILAGEFSGTSKGVITADGLRPTEYVEERGRLEKRESATLDWDAGVIRLKDDKLVPIETPIYDRLSVIMQFYYKPPVGNTHATRVTSTRYVETYRFYRRDDEALELPIGIVTAQVWRTDYEDGSPRVEIWMSPDYHYLPMRVRIHSKPENGGRFATLTINEIKVED